MMMTLPIALCALLAMLELLTCMALLSASVFSFGLLLACYIAASAKDQAHMGDAPCPGNLAGERPKSH